MKVRVVLLKLVVFYDSAYPDLGYESKKVLQCSVRTYVRNTLIYRYAVVRTYRFHAYLYLKLLNLRNTCGYKFARV